MALRPASLARRGLLVAAVAVLPLAGCGFRLRRPPELQLKRVHLAGFGTYSALADELRRQLRLSPGVELVDVPSQADVVLENVLDESVPTVATATPAGQVRELTLTARLRFRVRARDGRELIGETELAQTREMSYAENDALAKEHETQFLVRSMHSDIARQVLRRLAALGPEAAAAPAVPASR